MKKTPRKKWFSPGKSLNWSKDDGQTTRRNNALKARRGNYLKAARALLALANVTQDKETERKARADANFFFRQYSKSVKRKGKR